MAPGSAAVLMVNLSPAAERVGIGDIGLQPMRENAMQARNVTVTWLPQGEKGENGR